MPKARILLVEDESIVAKDIQNGLKRLGYAVPAVASSGEEAIKKAAETHPDLVLMDIRLKGDIDGVEAAEQIRARFGIPVIYLTAYVDEDTLQRAKMTEPFGYILKPFQERELHAAVEMALYKQKVEMKLKESEARNQAFLKAIPDLMFRVSKDGTFLDFRAKEVDSYVPPSEFLGKKIHEVLPAEVAQPSMHYIEQALQTGNMQFFEYQLLMQGDMRDYEARFVVSGKDEVLVIARDVTERKRAEEKLREAEEKYRSIFENAVFGIFQTTPDGRFISANDAMARICGYTLPKEMMEAVEDISHQLYADPDRRMEFKHRLEEDGAVLGFEMQVPRKDGTEIWVSENARAVRDADGKLLYYEGMMEDITERKRAEEQVKASLKQKEVLLKEIHHRVKNNLQVISSLLNLQCGYIKDKQILEIFTALQNRIKSIALVHEQLYQSSDLARVDFSGYIRNLAVHLFRSYGIDSDAITLKINVDGALLEVDRAILCALIINELASNSLKHAFPADREGEIRIELRSEDRNGFTLMVSDNGVGFPEDVDFSNTESLGLQLVSTLTEQLGGTIELDTSGGAEFKIIFPA